MGGKIHAGPDLNCGTFMYALKKHTSFHDLYHYLYIFLFVAGAFYV